MTSFSTPLILQGTGPISYAHGLGKVPEIMCGVLVCESFDVNSNMDPGDEIPCSCFTQDGSSLPSSLPCSAALFGANATDIFVNTQWFNVLTVADLNTWNKLTGLLGPAPGAPNFKLRIYAIAL